MKEVTKREYLKEKDREERFLYCTSCDKLYKPTSGEKKDPLNNYLCPQHKRPMIWAEYCGMEISMLKDEIPYGRVPDDVTNEEIVADFNNISRVYRICPKCGSVYKYKSKDEGRQCINCGAFTFTTHSLEWIEPYRKYNQSEGKGRPFTGLEIKPEDTSETYFCFVDGKNAPQYEHHSLDEANKEADRLSSLSDNIGRKVNVLQLINTRTSKITIERS